MDHRTPRKLFIIRTAMIVSVFVVFAYLGSAYFCATKTERTKSGRLTTHHYDSMLKGKFYAPAAFIEANLTGKKVRVRVLIVDGIYAEVHEYMAEPLWRMIPKKYPLAGPGKP